ncbi:MAG: NAD(P)H-quinone oxidoreductase [Magnetospirillum sp. WYHS-4]
MTALPTDMLCIETARPGGAEVLRPARRPLPRPAPGEVLIRVAAAGVNRPDILQREGRYPPPPGVSDILGLEVSGQVAALGEGVADWREGDSLCALVGGGGYAEYCTAPAGQCLPVPAGLSFAEAACLPETFFTVWSNVFERAALRPGETFLVHGGAGGIGSAAIQLARHFGARVMATAGSDEKCALCRRLGANLAIDYRETDFVAAAGDFTGGRGVDVILDMVGGSYVARNLKALASEGRLVQIAFQAGSKVDLDLMPLMLKRLTLTGSTLRIQSLERKAAIAAALKDRVWPPIEAGHVRPQVSATYPLAQAAKAHRRMDGADHWGKIALLVDAIPLP